MSIARRRQIIEIANGLLLLLASLRFGITAEWRLVKRAAVAHDTRIVCFAEHLKESIRHATTHRGVVRFAASGIFLGKS